MGKRENSSKDKKKRKRIKIERGDVGSEKKNKKDKSASSSSSEEEIARKKKVNFENTTSSSSNNNITSASKKAFFLKKKIDIDASLLPSSLHNCEEAVEDSIRGLLMKYSDGLGGILMGYENVSLKQGGGGGGRGWVLNELPHIHYSASCDALVFCPAIGCEVCVKRKEERFLFSCCKIKNLDIRNFFMCVTSLNPFFFSLYFPFLFFSI